MGHNSHRQTRALAQRVKAEEPNCARCGQPIDPTLRYPHPMCFSLGHIIPVSQAPHLERVRANARAEHLDCNRKAGDRTTLVTPSEQW